MPFRFAPHREPSQRLAVLAKHPQVRRATRAKEALAGNDARVAGEPDLHPPRVSETSKAVLEVLTNSASAAPDRTVTRSHADSPTSRDPLIATVRSNSFRCAL